MIQETTHKYFKQISRAIELEEKDYLIKEFGDKHYTDIAEILYHLNTDESKYIFELLPSEVGADVLSDLDEDTRKDFAKHFTSAELSKYVNYMDSDDGADLLNELPVIMREEVINELADREKANYILDLLRYDEDCAGGLMAKELVKANINWNIKQCIEEIRRQAAKVDKVFTIYVIDDHDVLLGRVSLKKIILSNENALVKDIYVPEITKVHTYQGEEDVAELMQKYDLEVIPVVNVQGKLLGRITIDDIVDVITEKAEIDQQAMAGISEDVDEHDNVLVMAKARLPWLLIGMLGGLLGAQFLSTFEGELATVPAIAFFIPLITATGGNVGIQSSTVVVQSLAHFIGVKEEPWQRFVKMIAVAIINGVTIAGFVFIYNVVFNSTQIAIVVSSALFCVILLASIMGTITPIILDKFGVNPAVASGPFITTANDLLGLGVYFSVAKLMYHI